ncbi:MAG: four helix bundle protein [Flavobacteriales bacterium]|nr:four helix bundle protein [Flavobacteriales bacterium]
MPERKPPSDVFPKSGGYKKLVSFKVAELLYDVTVRFCDKFIPLSSRTHDQMVQAARSGTRNIAEGSTFSATSKKIEMNLTNVAKSSLVELKDDYTSFLRQRKLPLWPLTEPLRQELIDQRCKTADEVAAWCKAVHERDRSRTYARNSRPTRAMCCVWWPSSLLDRQLQSQGETFKKEGGFSERLYRVRKDARD